MNEIKWIPVDEGLPNEYEAVLVTYIAYENTSDVLSFYYPPSALYDNALNERTMTHSFSETCVSTAEYRSNRFWLSDLSMRGERNYITAWARLPEPYKEAQNGNVT